MARKSEPSALPELSPRGFMHIGRDYYVIARKATVRIDSPEWRAFKEWRSTDAAKFIMRSRFNVKENAQRALTANVPNDVQPIMHVCVQADISF